MKTTEDRESEYAEALNDIADLLDMPTGATSAEIVTMAGTRWASGVHSCHSSCQRPLCVMRRQRDAVMSAMDDFSERIYDLETAIFKTLMDNLHLADGDNCTLLGLKTAIGFETEPE